MFFHFSICLICWRTTSFTPFCPFDFYKTEPYISLPLLSALSASQLNAGIVLGNTNAVIGSRSFHGYGDYVGPKRSFDNDFTRDDPNDIDGKVRIASLALAVRTIFNDVIVRRFVGFVRFVHLSTAIWKSS